MPGARSAPEPGQPRINSEPRRTGPAARGNRDEGEVFLKISSEIVTLEITVTDKQHRLIPGLESQHFEVYENGVMQKIEFFSSVDMPASIAIVFDASDSMRPKLHRAREALETFVKNSHLDDDFFLIAFNQRPRLVSGPADGATVLRQLAGISAAGSTALYDAAYLGVETLRQGRHKKQALLIVSDGQDNASVFTDQNLSRLLKESDVQVYCIGIEAPQYYGDTLSQMGRDLLTQLARTTGGSAFFPHDGGELEDAVTRIALELRRQYSVGYVPTNLRLDGKWRKIKVRLNPPPGLPRLVARTRDGYFANP
ncbi:MAG TPA: VWA domain-containing protein [Blastocatellia bacterium]|nr:VWA domain-containing protein [Blastocatellia bacterium]